MPYSSGSNKKKQGKRHQGNTRNIIAICLCKLHITFKIRSNANLLQPQKQGRKFHLTVGGDNIHKISQEQFLKGTQIIQLKLYL